MNQKRIVTVYYGDDWHKKIPKVSSESTRKSFQDWHERGMKRGVEFYRASIKWYDVKTNEFKKAWAYRNKKWIKVEKAIVPDMIFDKIAGKYDYELNDLKEQAAKKVLFLNHPTFKVLFSNKLSQYFIFAEFMAKSFIAHNENEFKTVIDKISSKLVVTKPLYGSGGFGITIDKKSKIKSNKLEYPVLVQMFIENNNGIPGFSKKGELADLRMIYMDHKLTYALSRVAKKGSLFTNFHQGASAILVPNKHIPKSVTSIAKKIIKKLSIFPNAQYSLDFMFDKKNKPILVELNTTPGFDLLYVVGDEKIKQKNFDSFVSILDKKYKCN